METCIQRRKNAVVQYISTRSLLDLCETAERNQGEQVRMRWREQAGIDLEMEIVMEAEVEANKDGMED